MAEIIEKGTGITEYNKPKLYKCLHQFDHEISVHNRLHKCFKSSKQYEPDTPNFHQAMSGEFSHKFKNAMDSELEGLTKRKVWSLVSRPPNVKVIPGTWAFKIK